MARFSQATAAVPGADAGRGARSRGALRTPRRTARLDVLRETSGGVRRATPLSTQGSTRRDASLDAEGDARLDALRRRIDERGSMSAFDARRVSTMVSRFIRRNVKTPLADNCASRRGTGALESAETESDGFTFHPEKREDALSGRRCLATPPNRRTRLDVGFRRATRIDAVRVDEARHATRRFDEARRAAFDARPLSTPFASTRLNARRAGSTRDYSRRRPR